MVYSRNTRGRGQNSSKPTGRQRPGPQRGTRPTAVRKPAPKPEPRRQKPEERRRDWSTDLGGLIRKAGHGLVEGADKASDVLVDKEAWSDIVHGQADKRDWANAALDATMLIPGAGLAGGVARIGARGLLRAGERQVAEHAVPKLTGLAAQVAERKAALGGGRAFGQEGGAAALARHRGTTALERGVGSAKEGLESVATRRTRALAGDETARIGGRRGVGNGARLGFNQSRRRVLTGAALSGGANLLGSAYNASGEGPATKAPGEGAGAGAAAAGIQTVGGVTGQATGFYLVAADGSTQALPDSAAKALAAAYRNMGGSPDGSQVIYMGR